MPASDSGEPFPQKTSKNKQKKYNRKDLANPSHCTISGINIHYMILWVFNFTEDRAPYEVSARGQGPKPW